MQKLVIAGAGTMGTSMAQIFAACGFEVTLYDVYEQALDKSRQRLEQSVNTLVESGSISQELGRETLGRIAFSSDKECFRDCQAVVENVVEDLQVKRGFFEEISRIVPESAILATNTSGLSINSMAEVVHLPQRFIGMHWFNPPHLVLLVEIIKGDNTSDETAQAIYDLCLQIGKKPVLVHKDVRGFAANRLQVALLREALALIGEGVVSPEGIDDILKYGLGSRWACVGPVETADLGGLDIWEHVCSYVSEDLSTDREFLKPLRERVERGELGVKSGRGFYDYSGDKAERTLAERDRKMLALFNALHQEK